MEDVVLHVLQVVLPLPQVTVAGAEPVVLLIVVLFVLGIAPMLALVLAQ